MSVKNLKDVDAREDFVQMENRLLKWWYEKGIVEKYLNKNAKSKKHFSFIDGPITANNPMGVHHAWGRTYKDVVQRYKNLQGYEQRFQNGFDCQGLWVEVEVEKALGFNSKKDIEGYGLDKFTQACIDRVNKFAGIQTDQSKRLGMFMDWDNSYYTMSETNNLYIWAFLKLCHEKDLLYKSKSATTWCPRCETGLSQHEQADGYMEVEDKSVYVLFRLEDRDDEYVLAWTTTPWTLSANVLLAINPAIEYVKAKWEGKVLYLAKDSAKRLNLNDVEEIDASALIGLKYESLYDIPAQEGVDHYIVEWDMVDATSGSGVVHIAPGCGAEDFELGQELGVPALSPLNSSGHYEEGYGELSGKYAHDVADFVIETLKEKDQLFKIEMYKHTYPHCWRCRTKCLFRLEDNWFIAIDKIRGDLKKQAEKVNWMPEFAGKRMQDWLKNMDDWMISRKRYYGLSLPFYECSECNKLHVVGSKEELKKLAVEPEKVDSLPSLHRPWIDEVQVKCEQCSKPLSRVLDVGDCWLDAGVVPFSTLKYFEDKEYWKKWFPANFVTEMIEQVRLWFYSMLVFGTVFEGEVPYQNLLGFAELRDENNNRMSKSKPNYVEFNVAADKVGTDMLRWNFVTASTGANMRFGWPTLEDVRRRFYLILWNSYGYFVTYAKLADWDLSSYDHKKVSHIMDRWLVAKVHKLVLDVQKAMDDYNMAMASRDIEEFVKELSTWYIRRSRDRFKDGDSEAVGTLHYAFMTLTKLLAPFIPFVAEEMYQNLVVNMGVKGAKESVHHEDYPSVSEKDVDGKVLDTMEKIKIVASMGLSIRDENKLKLKQPLSEVEVSGVDLDADCIEMFKQELNVQEARVVKEVSKGGSWKSVQQPNGLAVAINIELTDDLKKKGMYREVVRQIQNSRKLQNFNVGELVNMRLAIEDPMLMEVVTENQERLLSDASAKSIQLEKAASDDWQELKIEGSQISVKLEKAD